MSKPPPYGWASVHPLHVIHSSFGGGSEYCSLRSLHHDLHRTDGPQSIRFAELSGSLRWEQAPTVRMGFSPSAQFGIWAVAGGASPTVQSKPPAYKVTPNVQSTPRLYRALPTILFTIGRLRHQENGKIIKVLE